MGGNSALYAHLLAERYAAPYTGIFGALPELADAQRFPARAGPVADPAIATAWEKMTAVNQAAVDEVFDECARLRFLPRSGNKDLDAFKTRHCGMWQNCTLYAHGAVSRPGGRTAPA